MSIITMAANSTTLILNGYAFTSEGEGDFITLEFPNDNASMVNSGDGGVSVKERLDGGVCNATVMIQKFSDDDIFLNSSINAGGITVFNGSVKENFLKDSIDSVESYILETGIITKRPTNTKNNTDGNAVMEYVIQFRNAQRNM